MMRLERAARTRLCVLLAAACTSCALPAPADYAPDCAGVGRQALVGGSSTPPARSAAASWSGVGALWNDSEPICTAVVLSAQWALTARHCRSVFRATAPTLRLAVDGTELAVARLQDAVEHPTADLMLLRVESWTPALPPDAPVAVVAAPLDEAWLGREATLAGWGVDERGTHALRFLQQPIVDLDGEAIVVDGSGVQGACLGDSGGPLLVPQGETFALAGLLSKGDASCRGRDVYVRVDTERAWLAQSLAGFAAAQASQPLQVPSDCGARAERQAY